MEGESAKTMHKRVQYCCVDFEKRHHLVGAGYEIVFLVQGRSIGNLWRNLFLWDFQPRCRNPGGVDVGRRTGTAGYSRELNLWPFGGLSLAAFSIHRHRCMAIWKPHSWNLSACFLTGPQRGLPVVDQFINTLQQSLCCNKFFCVGFFSAIPASYGILENVCITI